MSLATVLYPFLGVGGPLAIVLGKHMLGVSTPPKKKWLKSSEDKEMGYPHKMVKVECSEEESIDEAETEVRCSYN